MEQGQSTGVDGVQFTVDRRGAVTAVVLTPELWLRILDRLEDVEDRALVEVWRERLENHPRDWALRWEDVEPGWA